MGTVVHDTDIYLITLLDAAGLPWASAAPSGEDPDGPWTIRVSGAYVRTAPDALSALGTLASLRSML
jgi:hypothetical protein